MQRTVDFGAGVLLGIMAMLPLVWGSPGFVTAFSLFFGAMGYLVVVNCSGRVEE